MGKFAEISDFIQRFDIVCLQETWLRQSNKTSFKEYIVFRNDRNDLRMGGGSMIICKKSLNPLEHRINSASFLSYDISIISILDSKISHDRIYIISLYKPPNINFKINHWREFFDPIDSITSNSQTFILRDLNSQNKA